MTTLDRRAFISLGGGIAVLTALPLAGCGGGNVYPSVAGAGGGPVATAPSGRRVQALGQQHNLVVTEASGQQRRVGGLGTAAGQFNYPAGVAVMDGRTYVVETGNHRVQVLDDKNAVLGFIGEGTLLYPGGIAAGGGEIIVSDSRNGRLVVFAPDGRLLRVLGQGVLSAPRGLDIVADGILVADPGLHKVLKLSATGAVLGEYGSGWFLPYDVSTDGDYIYVADVSRAGIGVTTLGGDNTDPIALDLVPTHLWFTGGKLYFASPGLPVA
jgi:DNA-binding beta-propeller fold protein YncE